MFVIQKNQTLNTNNIIIVTSIVRLYTNLYKHEAGLLPAPAAGDSPPHRFVTAGSCYSHATESHTNTAISRSGRRGMAAVANSSRCFQCRFPRIAPQTRFSDCMRLHKWGPKLGGYMQCRLSLRPGSATQCCRLLRKRSGRVHSWCIHWLC